MWAAELLRRLEAVERMLMAVYRQTLGATLPLATLTPETHRAMVEGDRRIRRNKVVPIVIANPTRPRRNHAKVEVHWGRPEDDGA